MQSNSIATGRQKYKLIKTNQIFFLSNRGMIKDDVTKGLVLGSLLFLLYIIFFYSIYQYFMSINSFFNTISVSRYSRPITVTRDPD